MLWVTGTPADSRELETTSNDNLTVRVDRDLLIQTHYRKMLSPLMATPTTQEQMRNLKTKHIQQWSVAVTN